MKDNATAPGPSPDRDTEAFLALLAEQEKVRVNRLPGVRIVLVILSSRGMVFDVESLRQKILLSYPDVAVFFLTTLGKAIGVPPPQRVDLLIDFTGPRMRQSFLYAKKLRRMARVAVGRNAGLFRKRIYDRVFDEKANSKLPADILDCERFVQRKVLGLAGIPVAQAGDAGLDRGKSIALELPALARL